MTCVSVQPRHRHHRRHRVRPRRHRVRPRHHRCRRVRPRRHRRAAASARARRRRRRRRHRRRRRVPPVPPPLPPRRRCPPAPPPPFPPPVPAAPEPPVPAVPVVPAVPDVPAVPVVPAVPDVPAVPVVPAVPEVPALPVPPLPPVPVTSSPRPQFDSSTAPPTNVTVRTKNSLRLSNFGSVDLGSIVILRGWCKASENTPGHLFTSRQFNPAVRRQIRRFCRFFEPVSVARVRGSTTACGHRHARGRCSFVRAALVSLSLVVGACATVTRTQTLETEAARAWLRETADQRVSIDSPGDAAATGRIVEASARTVHLQGADLRTIEIPVRDGTTLREPKRGQAALLGASRGNRHRRGDGSHPGRGTGRPQPGLGRRPGAPPACDPAGRRRRWRARRDRRRDRRHRASARSASLTAHRAD